jgi:hypothetical protein
MFIAPVANFCFPRDSNESSEWDSSEITCEITDFGEHGIAFVAASFLPSARSSGRGQIMLLSRMDD